MHSTCLKFVASIAHEIGNPVGLLALNSEIFPRYMQQLEQDVARLHASWSS